MKFTLDRPEVWHEPFSDAKQPGGIHIDEVPSWFAETRDIAELGIIQFHIKTPQRPNHIDLSSLWFSAVDLPRFITHDLKTEDPKTFQGLKEICITDVSEGNCVVFHPQLRSQVTSKKVLEKLSAAQSVRSRLPVWRVRLRGAAVDERDLQLPTDIICSHFKRSRSSFTCHALVVSIPVTKPSKAATLRSQLIAAISQHYSEKIQVSSLRNDTQVHLYYERRTLSTIERGLLVLAYIVLSLYMLISVGKIKAVMSRAGLALAAASIMTASVTSGVGACCYFGLVRDFKAFEVIPFLVMVIGLDNITTITNAVVSAPPTVAVRFRIAHGLSHAGPQLCTSLLQMEAILLFGAFSHIPQLRDFSIVACAAMLCNFSFQLIIYVAVMSLDMRRLELSDLMQQDIALPNSASITEFTGDERIVENLLRNGSSSRGVVINTVLVVMSMIATVLLAVLSGRSQHYGLDNDAFANTEASWVDLALMASNSSLKVHSASLRSGVLSFLPVTVLSVHDTPIHRAANATLMPPSPSLFLWNNVLQAFTDVANTDITQVVFVFLALSVVIFWVRTIVKSAQHALFGQREDVDSLAAMSLIDVEIGSLNHGHTQLELFAINTQLQLVLTCSISGAVSVWDLQTHRHLSDQEYNDSQGDVPWCMTTHAHFVGLGFNNGIVEVWELHTQHRHILLPPNRKLADRPPRVTQIAFSGTFLIAGRADGVIETWLLKSFTKQQDSSPAIAHTHRRHPSVSPVATANSLYGTEYSPQSRHRRTLSAESTTSVLSQSSSATFCYESFNTLKSFGPVIPATIEHICSRRCHTSTVTCMTVFGDYIITAGRDASIRVLRKLDFGISATLTGHTGPISCMTTFSGPTKSRSQDSRYPSASVIVSGSADGTVRVWDIGSWEIEAVFEGHEDVVTHVSANRIESIHVVSLGQDDTLRMWSRHKQICIRVLQPKHLLHSLILHPSSILITVSNAQLIAWDVMASGERIRTISLNIDNSEVPFLAHQEPLLHDAHMMELVSDDIIVCSVGPRLYIVRLPFPTLRKHKHQ
eukprot:gene11027-3097_t